MTNTNDNTIVLPSTAKIQSQMLQDPLIKQALVWNSLCHSIPQLADRTMRKIVVYQKLNKAIVALIRNTEHINQDARKRRSEWLPEVIVTVIKIVISDHVTQLEAAASLSQHLKKLGLKQESRDLATRVILGIF